ncbi:unnamed protein product [Rodentolepis nana]|uniref:Uncharacterized protein n=1 Tax=Rodentolepis nana TaxID=102285 RepID=A0A0R3T6Y3_RODNA|nr:unnamed protein product [Rodentolepis nana]
MWPMGNSCFPLLSEALRRIENTTAGTSTSCNPSYPFKIIDRNRYCRP